jgi:hypothetical protein
MIRIDCSHGQIQSVATVQEDSWNYPKLTFRKRLRSDKQNYIKADRTVRPESDFKCNTKRRAIVMQITLHSYTDKDSVCHG